MAGYRDSTLWRRTFCSASLRPHRGLERPFPFREPVPAAPAAALVVQHISTTLWADKIDDRGNDARVHFARYRLEPHSWLSSVAINFIPEELGVDHIAKRSRGPRVTVDSSRVSVALKSSVLVGCGVRLGHLSRLPPRPQRHLANAMPMSKRVESLERLCIPCQTAGKRLARDGDLCNMRQSLRCFAKSVQV
jgi:hypothetical protein